MRRRVLAAITLAVVVLLATAPFFIAAFTPNDPTVIEVAAASQSTPDVSAAEAVTRTVDGIGFPDWTRWGWTAIGGRADQHRQDRDSFTVQYRKGTSTIAYTIVEGTGEITSEPTLNEKQRTSPGGKVSLSYGQLAAGQLVERPCPNGDGTCTFEVNTAATTIKRTLGEHRVVLAAWPVSEALADEAGDLALRTTPRPQR